MIRNIIMLLEDAKGYIGKNAGGVFRRIGWRASNFSNLDELRNQTSF